jgi:hypothetical protein
LKAEEIHPSGAKPRRFRGYCGTTEVVRWHKTCNFMATASFSAGCEVMRWHKSCNFMAAASFPGL